MQIIRGLVIRDYSDRIVEKLNETTTHLDAVEALDEMLKELIRDCGVVTEDLLNPEFMQSIQDTEDALNGNPSKIKKVSPEVKKQMEDNYKKIMEKSKFDFIGIASTIK